MQHVDVSAHDHEVEEEVKAIVKNSTKATLHFRRTLEEPFESTKSPQRRQALYVEYCFAVLTPRIRGRCCVMAERVYNRALADPADAVLMRHCFLAALAAHKATDCPKKYPAFVIDTLSEIFDSGAVPLRRQCDSPKLRAMAGKACG